MDYISREELEKAMYHEAFETDTDLQKWDGGCWIRYKLFENVIEHLPAADVVARKHGKWIRSKIPNEKYVCSECGGACWYYDCQKEVIESKFCPNCGADMREVDE